MGGKIFNVVFFSRYILANSYGLLYTAIRFILSKCVVDIVAYF